MTGTAKQVIVIRRDLGMRRGKEIAQGAHASTMWLTERLRNLSELEYLEFHARMPPDEPQRAWVNGSFTKVTCQVSSEEELLAVMDRARAAGVEAHLVTDQVTGELRLY